MSKETDKTKKHTTEVAHPAAPVEQPYVHPATIAIDHSTDAQRVALPNGPGKFSIHDVNGQKQVYAYPEPANGAPARFTFVNELSTVEKTTGVGEVYFDVNKTDLRYHAGSKASDLQKHDALKYVKGLTQTFEQTLLKPGNEKMEIKITGQASATGSEAVDQRLSDLRAQHTYEAIVADIRKSKHPELASRITFTTEGVGKHELTVNTSKENTLNRDASIISTVKQLDQAETMYPIYQLDQQKLQRMRWEPGYAGANLTQEATSFADKTAVPSPGTVLVDAFDLNDLSKPAEYMTGTLKPGQFRLMVKNGDSFKLGYNIMNDHDVMVTLDGKPVMKLNYALSGTADGVVQPLQESDIHIANARRILNRDEYRAAYVGSNDQQVQYAEQRKHDAQIKQSFANSAKPMSQGGVDGSTLQQPATSPWAPAIPPVQTTVTTHQHNITVTQETAAASEQAALPASAQHWVSEEVPQLQKNVAQDVAAGGDVITARNIGLYVSVMERLKHIEANQVTTSDYLVFMEKHQGHEYREVRDRYQAVMEQFGSQDPVGNWSISTEQMKLAKEKLGMFNAMLKEGDFQVPAGGLLTVQNVVDNAQAHNASAPNISAKTPGQDMGGRFGS